MGSSINLGRIFGIPIRLHYTWFLIFVLITVALLAYFPQAYPLWQRVSLGIAASLLFFVSITTHEIAHSLIAINNGIPVKGITLFVFGGVSQITKEATRPIVELLVAVVGPLSSLIIAGIFYFFRSMVIGLAGLDTTSIVVTGLDWLAFINVMLALFNLIPGFPLDGGRIFRAILWMRTHDYSRATRIATLTGRGIGFLFIFGGILVMVLARQWFNGLWIAFIGWFLENAAAASYRQALLREALHGFTARDIMSEECPFIPRQLSLGQLVRDYILPTGRRCFIVIEDSKLQGIVTLRDIKPIPQERWDSILIDEIMTPLSKLKSAQPNQPAVSLLEEMDEFNINQMPVLEGDKVIGMVARDGLIRFLRTRAELGI